MANRTDNIPFAVAAIVVCVLSLSLGDALIKHVSAELPLSQIFVMRSLLIAPILGLWLTLRHSRALLAPRRPVWTVLRSLLLVLMWLLYYIALPRVELSAAAAAFYTLPLFITLFSAWTTHDRVGATGWIAVVLGFIGVLLILRPDAENFNVFALLPLASAVCYAIAMILTRTRCADEHPVTLAWILSLTFIVVGLIAWAIQPWFADVNATTALVLKPWTSMGHGEWTTIALLAVALLIGSVGTALAYQAAPPSVVSTFDFAYVVFAVLWGWLFFAETPATLAMVGIALVVVAGIIAVRSKA